jgi:hypothetical protein
MPQIQEMAADSAADSLRIFEVSSGHPINLSQWGGPDYEFAFNVLDTRAKMLLSPSSSIPSAPTPMWPPTSAPSAPAPAPRSPIFGVKKDSHRTSAAI